MAKSINKLSVIIEHELFAAPGLQTPNGNGGVEIVPLDALLMNPKRVDSRVELIDVDSFCSYVNVYKEPDFTALFAGAAAFKVTAKLDYHRAGAENEPEPRSCTHTCTLSLDPDPDWQAWMGFNGKYVSQDEFAQFLDSQQWVIIEPDAASVRDIVLKFQATAITKFERPVYDEVTGSVKMSFVNEAEQKGTMKLPGALLLHLAPFRSAPRQSVEAKLRWRFREGSVAFGFEIVRPDKIAETAFLEVIDHIESETGYRAYIGR